MNKMKDPEALGHCSLFGSAGSVTMCQFSSSQLNHLVGFLRIKLSAVTNYALSEHNFQMKIKYSHVEIFNHDDIYYTPTCCTTVFQLVFSICFETVDLLHRRKPLGALQQVEYTIREVSSTIKILKWILLFNSIFNIHKSPSSLYVLDSDCYQTFFASLCVSALLTQVLVYRFLWCAPLT